MLDDDDKLDKTPGEGEEGTDESQDRELNVGSDDDLGAMEDFTFAEDATEESTTEDADEEDPMAIFDEFLAADDSTETQAPAEPEQELNVDFPELLAEELFAEPNDQQHPEPEGLLDEDILGYNEDNTATEILEERAYEQEAQTAEPASMQGNYAQDPIFESDAFDDINSEQLFDYDPSATDASSSGEVFASIDTEDSDLTGSFDEELAEKRPGMADRVSGGISGMLFGIIDKLPARIRDVLPVKGAGGGGAGGGGGDIAAFKRRRMMRMLSMLFLIILMYSLLRGCLGGKTDVAMETEVLDGGDTIAVVDEQDEVPFDEADISVPAPDLSRGIELDTTDSEPAEDFDFDVQEQQETAPAATVRTPSDLVAEIGGSEQVAVQPEQLQEQLEEGLSMFAPELLSQMAVALPTQPEAMPGHDDQGGPMTQKLSDLQASLLAIDDRLDELNFQMRDERIARLENLLGDTSSPEAQAILVQALAKMENIDEKLSRLDELQRSMRSLDSEMRAIKTDIEQQTMIVGEQQREVNQSLAVARMQQETPPKIVVQAAIPGRAWLRSETGELLTVIPGDEVSGYGRVISIDAATGMVVMSSRAVFREG